MNPATQPVLTVPNPLVVDHAEKTNEHHIAGTLQNTGEILHSSDAVPKNMGKRETKTIEVRPAINTSRTSLWITSRVFNYCYRILQSFYIRVRTGSLRVIIPSVSLVCLLVGAGFFIYILSLLRDDVLAITFISGALCALFIYIMTVLANLLAVVTKLACAPQLARYDALAFTTYIMLSSLTIIFQVKGSYQYQIIIFALTYIGGNMYTIFLALTTLLVCLWFPFSILEFAIRLLICKLGTGYNKTKVVYETFPYRAEETDTKQCIICFYEYTEHETVCGLKCHKSHIFHEACFLEWVKKQAICPICRASLSQ